MLDCKLCGETSYTRYICDDCNFIKDCINIYSKNTVIDVIQRTLIRDEKQRTYKIDSIVKERLKKELDDNSYLNKEDEILKRKNHLAIKTELLDKLSK